jgi:hypothetical protein
VFWLLGVKPILGSLWITDGTSLLSSGWSILGYELSEWGSGFRVSSLHQSPNPQSPRLLQKKSINHNFPYRKISLQKSNSFLPFYCSQYRNRSIAVKSSKDRSYQKAQKKDRLQRKARKNFEVIPIHSRPILSLLRGYLILAKTANSWLHFPHDKRIQNAQETGKHETHQAAEFVVHQTDRRGAICFLVCVAIADFSFTLWRRLDLSNTVPFVQQQEGESTT